MVQFGNREADERCASSCGVAKATVAITASRDGSSCIIQDKRPLICQAHSLQEDKDVEPETLGDTGLFKEHSRENGPQSLISNEMHIKMKTDVSIPSSSH